MGIYVFNAAFLYEQLIRDADDPRSRHDFGKDVIPRLIARGYRVFAHRFADCCVNMSRAGRTGATSARSTRIGRRTSI